MATWHPGWYGRTEIRVHKPVVLTNSLGALGGPMDGLGNTLSDPLGASVGGLQRRLALFFVSLFVSGLQNSNSSPRSMAKHNHRGRANRWPGPMESAGWVVGNHGLCENFEQVQNCFHVLAFWADIGQSGQTIGAL